IILILLGVGLFVSALLVNVEMAHSEIINKMKFLLLQLAVILVCAKLGGEFFAKALHQPAVLGELLAGVFIGPFALGALHIPILDSPLFPLPPGAKEGLTFPISPELYGMATLAAVILLFLAGLETDFKLFLQQSFAGSLVGLGGVAGAFFLGDLTTVWFGYAHHFMDPVALFMGTISVATSVGITARVLSEQKSLDTPEGTTILAGAVIDDVLGILILAVVVGMVGMTGGHHDKKAASHPKVIHKKIDSQKEKSNSKTLPKDSKEGQKDHGQKKKKKPAPVDWEKVGLIGYRALGFWLGATLLGILFASQIAWFLTAFNNRGTMMALGLGLALVFAGLAEMVGLAAIIGAYAIGLALSKEDVSKDLEHAFEGIYSVLVPVFFCVMGMLVNVPAMVSHPDIIIFSLVYALIAIVSKIIGCGAPTYLVGFNTKGALRVGIGMLPRGEVALIVAGVGLAGNIIDLPLFGVAIAMTLLTTLMAPPFLVKLFDGTSGLRKKKEAPEGAEEKAAVASEKAEAVPASSTSGTAILEKAQTKPGYQFVNVGKYLHLPLTEAISEVMEEKGFSVKVVGHDPIFYRAWREDGAVMEIHKEGDALRFDLEESHRDELRELLEKGLAQLKAKVKAIQLRKITDEESS
ncbi:MAG: cation:proton antiporter, partial [Planctomycetota bacterium]